MIVKQDRTPEVQNAMDGMMKKNRELSLKVGELATLAETMAEDQRNYNVAYGQKLLALKLDGCAATYAKELCRSNKAVADLKFKQNVSKAIYDACREQIRALNVAIDTYR